MKIEENQTVNSTSPLATSPLRQAHGGAQSAGNVLEDMDLSFLELLNTLQGAEGLSDLSQSPKAEILRKVVADLPIHQAIDLLQRQRVPESTEAESRTDAVADVPSKKELEWFRLELKPEDLKLLPSLLPNGLPASNVIPFQSFTLPEGEGGVLQERGMAVSKGLGDLIEKAYKTGRPVRVDLDKNASIILKIREGKVSAEFLSADPAMVLYLKQQLADLRNRMEAKNLPVGTLESRQDDSPKRHPQQPEEDSPENA